MDLLLLLLQYKLYIIFKWLQFNFNTEDFIVL